MAVAQYETCEDGVWFDRHRYEDAEHEYQQQLVQQACSGGATTTGTCTASLKSAHSSVNDAKSDAVLSSRLTSLELDNKSLKQTTKDLEALVKRLELRIHALENGPRGAGPSPAGPAAPSAQTNGGAGSGEEEEDDFELFGDEAEDDEEAERVKQERVKAYEDKKAKKPVLIAKSNIILDVKPWDDETDMAELEKCVRSIEMDGLLWGASKLVPLAYTIKKLQISCVVEDDKVSTEDLEERITAFEDYIQSVDIAAFNKV